MKKIALIITILLSSSYSYAEKEIKWGSTKEISIAFMELISAEKYKEAYQSIAPYWFIPEHEINSLIYKTEQQMPQIKARFGKSLSFEKIRTEEVGNSIIKDIYIQKFENHALAWMIMYYKSKDDWKVNSVIFNDQLHTL